MNNHDGILPAIALPPQMQPSSCIHDLLKYFVDLVLQSCHIGCEGVESSVE
jgi:hypothetical protein